MPTRTGDTTTTDLTSAASASSTGSRRSDGRAADGPASGAPASGSVWRPRHLPQLDGLRTVAMALVLTYHALREQDLPGLGGAFVGVDVFFVLSGFLITSLLLREHAETGGVDLRRFYLRRLWRLYPALLLVCAVVAAVFAWAPASLGFAAGSPWESLVALAYGMSWWSGLELPGGPYLLGLTWSLSVEEHFYLLWPLVLLAVLRRGGRVGAVVVVAVLANAWPAVLWLTGADPDRLYFMADTRFAQMLTGCVLAVALAQRGAVERLRPFLGPRPAAAAAAWIAFVVVVADRYQAWYWVGGMQVVGVAAAVVVGHLVLHDAGSGLVTGLSRRPMVLLGVWSYGTYLWHLPLMRLAQPVFGDTLLVTVVAGLAAVPLAAASYRYVEQPLLRRRARRVASVASADRPVPVPAALRPVAAGPAHRHAHHYAHQHPHQVRPAELLARQAA